MIANKKEVNSELENLVALKSMVEAYEEIAASRMRKIRNVVLASRDFLLQIALIFQQVKLSYKKEVERLLARNKGKDKTASFMVKNKQTIAVLLSSNTGLYGDIIQKTFRLFINDVKAKQYEVAIIGKLGLSLFQAENLKLPYKYFELDEAGIKDNFTKEIANYLLNYEKILVYYGKFQTLLTQEATSTIISGDLPETTNTNLETARFLFEPSLEKIMEFFETEIFESLFDQTLQESQLAKFASRMMSLNLASGNITHRVLNVNLLKRKLAHEIMNKKQLAFFTTTMLWRK